VVRLAKLKVALRVGSCAAKTYKPRQVRKEAAVSNFLRVPQGSLAGANFNLGTWYCKSKHGAWSCFIK